MPIVKTGPSGLLPCPFCGLPDTGNVEEGPYLYGNNSIGKAMVMCSCGIRVDWQDAAPKKAVEVWNSRAKAPSKDQCECGYCQMAREDEPKLVENKVSVFINPGRNNLMFIDNPTRGVVRSLIETGFELFDSYPDRDTAERANTQPEGIDAQCTCNQCRRVWWWIGTNVVIHDEDGDTRVISPIREANIEDGQLYVYGADHNMLTVHITPAAVFTLEKRGAKVKVR